MKNIWFEVSDRRWPWIGSDGEYDTTGKLLYSRHTLVIPFPIARETTWDWNKYFSAVVVSIPEWLNRCDCLEES